MKLIGVTGGVGSGKSEVLNYLKQHYQAVILKADEAARQIESPGGACYQKLLDLLGEDILKDPKQHSEIDPVKMGARIFSDPALVQKVNEIVHPAVKDFILDRVQEERKSGEAQLFFLEAALLIECGYNSLVDEMWYIYTRREIRRQRLKLSRSYSDEKIEQIMKNQLDDEEFRRASDFVIDNSGSFEQTAHQLNGRLKGYNRR